jgi:hypothetical protein
VGDGDLSEVSAVALADGVEQLAALSVAAHAVCLRFVAAMDRRRAWRGDGAPSMAAWLAGRLGLPFGEAAEWVRVAEALERLPELAAVYGQGVLSFAQLRLVTRVATGEDDAEWARRAPGLLPAALEREVGRRRAPTAAEAVEAYRMRSLRMWWDPDRMLRLSGRLPADGGAVVVGVLERAAAEAPRNPHGGVFDSPDARCADALVGLCSRALGDNPGRATVVVHIQAETLAGADGEIGRAHV